MTIEVKISVKPIDYLKSMEILEERVIDVLNEKKDEFLWIIEHNPVYTAGTSSKKADLLDKKIKVIKTNRGGKHTYHGPGQKVVYFVLNLNKRGKDVKKLIYNVEECIINILKEYKIKSFADKKNIGIWTNQKNNPLKIGAIGIRIKKWVAYHGFAINVSNNPILYKGIVPCGIKDKGITTMKEMGVVKFDNINEIIKNNFLNTFHLKNS